MYKFKHVLASEFYIIDTIWILDKLAMLLSFHVIFIPNKSQRKKSLTNIK